MSDNYQLAKRRLNTLCESLEKRGLTSKYEDDPKGKRLKVRLSAHATGQNRHSPYNATNRRQMYKEESIPNTMVSGYKQVISFENIQKRLKQEMYQQCPSSSSSSASCISTTALEMSPLPGMTQLDMIAPPNAVAPYIDLSTGDASTGDLSSPGPLPEIIQNQHFGKQQMQMNHIPHPYDSSSSGILPMEPDGKAPNQEVYLHGMMLLYRPPYMGMPMHVGSYYPIDNNNWQQPGQPDQQPNVCGGDLVIIVGENIPRRLWPLVLVVEVRKGRDDLVRSVTLKTKSTKLVRPVTNIAALEV